ncbi:hypothetical protein CVT24_000504 [Panaeolus cyanescens]|uniref:Uncharacterized protein n=1 Tax=Panaeolus cyanescens TaxID=181874 RepID=A0A409VDD0_9AGAR|nr:hypothetical protein CVT24_000504 [Panaeolus cyanescens]
MSAGYESSHAGPSNSGVSRFIVQTSDVISDMRINVSDEATGKVIWFKERFLDEDEIIVNIMHAPTNSICWTIHRPTRGWYIRIRSPFFPPGVFIPLIPVPSNAPYHVDAAMSFNTRTNNPHIQAPVSSPVVNDKEVQFSINDEEDVTSSSMNLHSYPPTPSATTKVGSGSSSQSRYHESNAAQASSQITQFILAPTSVPPAQPQPSGSFFARALSVLRSHRPSHSSSFTLSRVLPLNPSSPPPPYASSTAVASEPLPTEPILHEPLLVFHDHTPVLTVRTVSGVIEIDKAEEKNLGVDTSFWIAMALTYLEFLEEREASRFCIRVVVIQANTLL